MKHVLVDQAKNSSNVMAALADSIIQVAVGIIFNTHGEVLIAQRPAGKSYSGLWEFPGGKIETHEAVFQALQRELAEELGIQVLAADAWFQLDYTYSDRHVLLHIWRIIQFSGEPLGKENQLIQWVSSNRFDEFQFLAGNQRILGAIRELTFYGH